MMNSRTHGANFAEADASLKRTRAEQLDSSGWAARGRPS